MKYNDVNFGTLRKIHIVRYKKCDKNVLQGIQPLYHAASSLFRHYFPPEQTVKSTLIIRVILVNIKLYKRQILIYINALGRKLVDG